MEFVGLQMQKLLIRSSISKRTPLRPVVQVKGVKKAVTKNNVTAGTQHDQGNWNDQHNWDDWGYWCDSGHLED